MDNYEKWASEGSEDSYKRANATWKQMLREYQPPKLDEAKLEELQSFVEQRRSEIRAGRLNRN